MNCPKCQASMRQYERNGITIDQCSECRGVFLDRGELDRLIDAESSSYTPEPARTAAQPSSDRQDKYRRDEYRGDDYRSDDYRGDHGHKRKRRGFLGELFDD